MVKIVRLVFVEHVLKGTQNIGEDLDGSEAFIK